MLKTRLKMLKTPKRPYDFSQQDQLFRNLQVKHYNCLYSFQSKKEEDVSIIEQLEAFQAQIFIHCIASRASVRPHGRRAAYSPCTINTATQLAP